MLFQSGSDAKPVVAIVKLRAHARTAIRGTSLQDGMLFPGHLRLGIVGCSGQKCSDGGKDFAFVLGVKPAEFILSPKPCELPFRETARIAFHQIQRFFEQHLMIINQSHMPVANATKRFEVQPVTATDQVLHFFEQAVCDHPFASAVDQIVELWSLSVECDQQRLVVVFQKSVFLVPLADWLTRQLVHFERSDDPLAIVWMDPRSGSGIVLREPMVKAFEAARCYFAVKNFS